MIKLMQLFPDHLNLNGDAGNLLVLQKRIEWSGLTSVSSVIFPGQTPHERPDILLIGHGSTAAWRQIYGELARLAPTIENWLKQGTQVIAVSSGFAALHGLISDLPKSIERNERRSIFIAEEFEGNQIFGYFNSDLQLPAISRIGNLLGTMLHGPLLAKNTWLADQIIESVRGSHERAEVNVSKLDAVESLAESARKLAEEQAKA